MQARSALALPREVSGAVFQLTDSSLTPAASQSWGSIPTASDGHHHRDC